MKLFLWGWFLCVREAIPKKTVHCHFQWFSASANFFFKKIRHIVVKGESRSHIMMFSLRHHDVNFVQAIRIGPQGPARR